MMQRRAVFVLVFYLLVGISGLTIVSRKQWGAMAPRNRGKIGGPVPYVIIHHSDTPACSGNACRARVKSIQNYHMNSLGICFIGNFMKTSPTNAALQSAKALIDEGVRRGYVGKQYKLVGHRDVGSTSCPGNKLHSIIKTWPHFGK
ncbi:unnamed protein product [Calicophoron daubneyi]|uniref:Peptidoglycan-recognition protein n=1 Tax=Calicophoron daubneyi TaxID=300641 RepID=A0AAV2TF04_CALDB